MEIQNLELVEAQLAVLNEHVTSLRAAKSNGTMPTTCSMKCLNENLKDNLNEVSSENNISSLNGENGKKKWSNLFHKSFAAIGEPLSYFPPVVRDGKLVVKLKTQEVRKVELEWEHAVMLYAPDLELQVLNIRRYARCVWPSITPRRILKHNESYFLMQLKSKEDQDKILEGGQYFMNRHPIVVKAWKVGFDIYADVLKSYPTWVQFHKLPVGCWGLDSLSRLASALGLPRFADKCTAEQKRLNFVRVLVDVDVTRPLITELTVEPLAGESFQQRVIYEYIPVYCEKCGALGHKCKPLRMVQKWIPKVPKTPPPQAPQNVETPENPIPVVDSDKEQGWLAATKIARHSVAKPLSMSLHRKGFAVIMDDNEDDQYDMSQSEVQGLLPVASE